YCVNSEDKGGMNDIYSSTMPHLDYKVLADLVIQLHKTLDFESVRLTGGEPMLYQNLIPFIQVLKSSGIKNVKMTTNGFNLKQKAEGLAEVGVKDINISLDAIDPEIFRVISRRNSHKHVIDGIEAAIKNGISVKLNAVIMRGLNENQIVPLLEYAIQKNIGLRYLELMRMGHFYSKNFSEYFFPMEEILSVISNIYPLATSAYRNPSATAKIFQLENGYEFGIIANESEPFCSDCDRLRLDSSGNIYGCLSEEKSEFIADIAGDETKLTEKLAEALKHKQPLKFKGSPLKMISIGG
ncbi:MAG: GTP 3',8-cyclase MoaA, partial [Ignavibacteriaceae bacterium]|nr:GTP 3',8-cyclase MoaA [Ignavibacteriaceae bacterium]